MATAVITAASQSTPEKPLKKSRVETEGADIPKKGLWSNDVGDASPSIFNQSTQPGLGLCSQPEVPPGLCQTGDMPDISDEVIALKEANQQLHNDKLNLQEQVAVLQEELAKLKIDGEPHELETPLGEAVPASDDAARKRLARICARNSSGNHGLQCSILWGTKISHTLYVYIN